MNYLLDTCVISELLKKKPNVSVVKWISAIDEMRLFISVFTLGEIYKGIEKLPVGKKRERLYEWVSVDLQERFNHKIIDFDIQTATTWGCIQAQSEIAGHSLPAIDGLIAATGMAHDLVVVTRNIKDMEISGVSLLNPWESKV
jgi:predicted nucleic acid-binding protein